MTTEHNMKSKSTSNTRKTSKGTKSKFDNQEKFEEHNKQLQIESQINHLINEIQEFLETHYSDENNYFMIPVKEPLVIAKCILHFKKMGWNLNRTVEGGMIKICFDPV